MTTDLANIPLYGILDLGYVDSVRCLETADAMLAGGVGLLQLRAKNLASADILSLARDIAPRCRAAGVPFVINDHPELVGPSEADGVHVGQDDMAVAEARRLAGPGKLVGLSTHSPSQAKAALDQQPDYIGFGPLFATPTKPDYPAIGIADIAEVHREVALPIFCIGGIKRENLPAVLASGARRVVIVSGILQAPDIAAYCRDCLRILLSESRELAQTANPPIPRV